MDESKEFFLQVVDPGFGEKGFESGMFQGFLDKGQCVEFEELTGFSEISTLGVKKLPKTANLLLRDSDSLMVLVEMRVYGKDEEVNFEVELEFLLFS